jgi:hypothetical protein
MPASSIFVYHADEQTSYDKTYTGFDDPNIEYEDPNIASDNSMDNFKTFAIGGGTTEDDFATGATTDNANAYNDVPLGNGAYVLIFMIFVYAIRIRIMRIRKLRS